jgi:hypothetical protein
MRTGADFISDSPLTFDSAFESTPWGEGFYSYLNFQQTPFPHYGKKKMRDKRFRIDDRVKSQ